MRCRVDCSVNIDFYQDYHISAESLGHEAVFRPIHCQNWLSVCEKLAEEKWIKFTFLLAWNYHFCIYFIFMSIRNNISRYCEEKSSFQNATSFIDFEILNQCDGIFNSESKGSNSKTSIICQGIIAWIWKV